MATFNYTAPEFYSELVYDPFRVQEVVSHEYPDERSPDMAVLNSNITFEWALPDALFCTRDGTPVVWSVSPDGRRLFGYREHSVKDEPVIVITAKGIACQNPGYVVEKHDVIRHTNDDEQNPDEMLLHFTMKDSDCKVVQGAHSIVLRQKEHRVWFSRDGFSSQEGFSED